MKLRKGNIDLVVKSIKSRIGKNKYTQGPKRNKVGEGYGDCSATVRWAYLQIGVDVGGFTGDQIKKGICVNKGPVAGGKLDIKSLKPGDLLFYKGRSKPSSFRPYGVGHVEMYIGNGKTCGHGSGRGPTVKNIKSYRSKDFIMAKRYVEKEDKVEKIINNKIAVTPYMNKCVDDMYANKMINSPDFWKGKLVDSITVGEAFALIKNIHFNFKSDSIVNSNDSYQANALLYLHDNKIINDLKRWRDNLNKSFPVWALGVILMNIDKQISPNSKDVTNKNFKYEAILYLNKNGLVNNPDIWIKKVDEPLLTWEVFAFLTNFYNKYNKK